MLFDSAVFSVHVHICAFQAWQTAECHGLYDSNCKFQFVILQADDTLEESSVRYRDDNAISKSSDAFLFSIFENPN